MRPSGRAIANNGAGCGTNAESRSKINNEANTTLILIRLPCCDEMRQFTTGGLTVGFSGSGGAGKTPSPKNYFAGSRRIPASGEAAVRCNTPWQAGACLPTA